MGEYFKELLEIAIGDVYTPWKWENYIPTIIQDHRYQNKVNHLTPYDQGSLDIESKLVLT